MINKKVVLKLYGASPLLGGLVKTRLQGFTPRVYELIGLD